MAALTRVKWERHRVLVFALGLLLCVFLTQVATHTHQNGQEDASCQVCQGAHVAPTPIASALATGTLVTIEYIRPDVLSVVQEFFFEDCPSRAPPSLLP
jgi:hypothetical protein